MRWSSRHARAYLTCHPLVHARLTHVGSHTRPHLVPRPLLAWLPHGLLLLLLLLANLAYLLLPHILVLIDDTHVWLVLYSNPPNNSSNGPPLVHWLGLQLCLLLYLAIHHE